jgi:hypothetical protein
MLGYGQIAGLATSDQQVQKKEEKKLVAAEEVGAHMRWQNGQVAARTGASFDPA